ncbi:two-component response regulator ORR41-like [Canna indica]|uniref:Two-component response regulator ORR41-like n=1 Tax=Canna indica TaxID=4628 RepID=A0AAQ3KPP3_9LILI|nr:two-component response regulator ORR41-like [Canna indica]
MASASGDRQKKVLLVEDTEINRVVVRRLITKMGELNVELEEAENGKVAVDFIREGKSYDLILMDKEMPVMNGHEATRQLRSLGVRTPIVALSGNNMQSDMDLFLAAGADHFEDKPLTQDKLLRILTKFDLLHGHTDEEQLISASLPAA